jgi:hypothetical protein
MNDIAVCVSGDHNTVSVCQRPYLTLRREPPRAPTRAPTREIEILYSHLEAIRYIDCRESDMARLQTWLDDPAQISVFAVKRAGGSCKTRLVSGTGNTVLIS